MRGKREQGSSTPFFESKRQVPVLLAVLIAMALVVTWGISTKGLPSASGDPKRPVPHHVVKVADVDPEAAGVNEGDKEQASGVKMKSIPKIDNKKVMGESGEFGGCTEGYGRGKQCLPPVSPAAVAMKMTAEEHPWDCGEVAKLFPKGIAVNKKGAADPLRLDYNRDGIACGAGD